MKILLIANYKGDVGGISGQVSILFQKLSQEGFDVEVFSTGGSIIKRLLAPIRLLQGYSKMFHIHTCSHWGFMSAVMGITIGKLLGNRVIVTYHGGGAEAFLKKHANIVKFFLSKADCTIVLSGFLKSVFDNYQIRNIIIPNILEFTDNQFKERREVRTNFISVRSLRPMYNIGCILKAFELVQKEYPKATLTILGDGISRAELEDYVLSRKILNVKFIGIVPNEKVYDYLNESDVFLSAPLFDNMPVSVLEAYNAGLLVISSNVGGIPYMLEDNVTGYLFESNNEVELYEKMILAISDQCKSLEIIKNAKREVEKYHWDNIKTEIFNCYQ